MSIKPVYYCDVCGKRIPDNEPCAKIHITIDGEGLTGDACDTCTLNITTFIKNLRGHEK